MMRRDFRWLLPPLLFLVPLALSLTGPVSGDGQLSARPPDVRPPFQCLASSGNPAPGQSSMPVYDYVIVNVYPHDPDAFTQGLVYDAGSGCLYESTGRYGHSSVRQVELVSGKVVKSSILPDRFFGEGLTKWKNTLVQLTWQSRIGFVYGVSDLARLRTFEYQGEGWGITADGSSLIMSDGSASLRFWDPATFQETGRIEVRDQGVPITYLNELEYIKGEIFANIWHSDRIARISPETGEVLGWLELAGLRKALPSDLRAEVLNGIAYDAEQDRIFVTGKLWPYLFEIRPVGPVHQGVGKPSHAAGIRRVGPETL